jgi:DNA-binding NtrC family response regulator
LAADSLKPIFSPGVQLPPDLYAEMERVTGKALAMSGATDLAQVHLHRACRTFDLIGNMVGKERVIKELTPTLGGGSKNIGASTSCLDRLRVLLDLRTRAELFGHEAVVLLQELACTEKITLSREHGNNSTTILQSTSRADALGTDEMTVVINGGEHTKVTLSFVPLGDAKSVLTALTFQHVMRQILHIGQTESLVGDQEILWSTNEPTSVTSGAVFASDLMLGVLRTVKQIAPTDVSVLITGETGAGKEVVARAVHELSHRSAMPFLGLNCAAVPKDLLESQLFGHRKGAFSGAGEAHQGIVRAANGGTLFLDEIGEIPIDVQAKLLRFLEMSEVHPVGETHPVKVNVRLIFATNGDLEEAVRQNRFRQDLFYRLNVIPIKVPALRERREEIPVLANVFAQRFATEFGKEPVRFSSSAMELLILYTWPGNIRQLANEVRRLTALTESGACITPDHLSPQLQAQTTQIDAAPGVPQMQVRIDQPLEKATAHLEAEMIKHALRQAGGRVTAAASTLGISRKGLYLKRLRLGLRDFNERAS